MSLPTLSQNDIQKLKQTIDEGVQVEHDINDMKEGLKEQVKSICEELDLKPALVNKAIKASYKSDLDKTKEQVSDVEEILNVISTKQQNNP